MVDNTTIQTSTYTTSAAAHLPGDFAMSLLVLVAAMMKADNKVLNQNWIMLSNSFYGSSVSQLPVRLL
jgi:hypothetical protein